MGEPQTEKTPAASRMPMIAVAVVLAVAAVSGAVYVNIGGNGNVAQGEKPPSGAQRASKRTGLARYSVGKMITFVARAEPRDLPEIKFIQEDGPERSLSEWRGKVVLLNLWATWCAPCRKEMPDLDELKAKLGGDQFDLVALSIDRGGLEKPGKFLKEIGVKHLKLYNNSSGKLASSLKAFGMPTTLLINRQGKEIGRLVGPAEWGSKEALALIQAAIAD